MQCNRHPWVRYFFWRQELKRLKQTTLATYFKFLSDYNIPEAQKWVYNAQDSVIRFANGSEILLLDLAYLPSDPLYTRFGSLELTGWYIDESAEIDEQCISIIMTRIWRQKNEEYGIAPKLLEWFNPDRWHVYRRYYKPWKDWTLPSYRTFIPALATDNKKLPKSYIEQLKKANEVTKQRLLYGNFEYDDTPWRLFEYDDILSLWERVWEKWDRYISIDVARKGKDKTVIFVWDWLHVERVIVEQKSDIFMLWERVKKLAQETKTPMRNIIVDEDGVWGWLVDNLRMCQWFVNNSAPRQRKKPNLSTIRNYQNLKTQCYFVLADTIKKIWISDSSIKEALSEELDIIVQTKIDSDTKLSIISKEDIKEKLWRSPDYADALMMRMYYEIDKIELLEEKKETNILTGIDLDIFGQDEIQVEFEIPSAY